MQTVSCKRITTESSDNSFTRKVAFEKMEVPMCTKVELCTLPAEMQVGKVQNYLDEESGSKTAEEIFNRTGVDINGNEEVMQLVVDPNSQITQEQNGKWRRKREIKNSKDLAFLLSRSSDGVVEKELCESYANALEDISQMKKLGLIYEVDGGDGVILYPRDRWLEVEISKDIVDIYNSVKLPDSRKVHRYLVKHNLKRCEENSHTLP